MFHKKLAMVGLVALASSAISGKAQAGCWVVWQGIKSHVECDSAGVVPTFENFKRSVNEIAGLSSSCKQSIVRTAGSYFSCGIAIVTAVKTGGATVWVGAGEACYEFSNELQDNQRQCRQYVNLRSKPISAKVCNQRPTSISVALARREVMERKVTSGWWTLERGECRTFSFADARVIYAMAMDNGQRLYPNWAGDDLDDKATFCIDRQNRHDNLDVDTCHRATSHHPYDFNKPGNLKFTNFGRVSGLPNGFTFR